MDTNSLILAMGAVCIAFLIFLNWLERREKKTTRC
jgi:hypothetical protein